MPTDLRRKADVPDVPLKLAFKISLLVFIIIITDRDLNENMGKQNLPFHLFGKKGAGAAPGLVVTPSQSPKIRDGPSYAVCWRLRAPLPDPQQTEY